MSVPIPEDALVINENLIAKRSDFKGRITLAIHTTYIDKEGNEALGKGITLSATDWEDFLNMVEDIDNLADEIFEGE